MRGRGLSCAMRARVAAGLVLAGVAPAASAQDTGPGPIDFYAKLYPEYKVQSFDTPSRAGTVVGTMGTLRNDRTVLTSDVALRERTEDHEWSNSYIAIRGEADHGGLKFGYDLQGLIDLQGSVRENFRTRDAYVFVSHARFGRLAVGQMDTTYKEAGDVFPMLGVSSGNFVSTSRVLSGTGWRPGGEASFHQRVNRSVMWTSPAWNGLNVMGTHAVRPVDSAPHLRPTLTAAAVQWRSGPWYAALATEVHRDWLPLSLTTTAPAAPSIRNPNATANARDQAWRLSGAWREGPWRVAADIARLSFSESGAPGLAGKFREYANKAGQVSVEYRINHAWRVAANHARAGAGVCNLSGNVACSTTGLGGHQTSLGVAWKLNDIVSFFALAAHWHNNPASVYGSSAQGASTRAAALGVRIDVP